MLANASLVAFVATSDSDAALVFYKEILGLRLLSDDPYAIAFDANGTTIRIQKLDEFTPQPFTALGWHVDDITLLAQTFRKRGVEFEQFPGMNQNDLGIWEAPGGAKVAWFKDPAGNTLSLTQA